MKIIFLDIDGCLNHEAFYRKRHEAKSLSKNDDSTDYPLTEFCPEAVENLNELVKQTGARIVVSSSWRVGRTLEEMREILQKAGVKGEIIGLTPDLRNRFTSNVIFRDNEIYAWMDLNRDLLGCELHKFRRYVILDDDADMLYWQRNNFILVDRFVGITKGTVFQAAKILNQ